MPSNGKIIENKMYIFDSKLPNIEYKIVLKDNHLIIVEPLFTKK